MQFAFGTFALIFPSWPPSRLAWRQAGVMRLILATGLLASSMSAWAVPTYQIDFSGTINSGTLKAAHQTEFSTFDVPFAPGSQFHASIFANFDLAPPPSINGNGVFWTVPMRTVVQIDLPALPVDVLLPIPGTFVILDSFSATSFLQFASKAQVVFPSITFDEPSPDGRNYKNQGVLSAFLGPGFGIDLPPGALYPAFAAKNLTGSGQFHVLKVDQQVSSDPPLFGLNQFYDISVSFTVTEASGGFVPEPGTAALLFLALPCLLALRRRGFFK